jgi:alpha-galactosidase
VQYTLGDRTVVLAWNTGQLDGLSQLPGRDLRLPLRGLDPGRRYRHGDSEYSGVHLMAVGLPVRWTAEHDAEMIELRAL